MALCEKFEKCAFFQKYEKSYETACKVFIEHYCRGSKMNECKRKEYSIQHGTPPPENMMPNGVGLIVNEHEKLLGDK
jgi:hypothetical protein